MKEIGAFEAKTHFSQLLARLAKGEEFIITLRGKRVGQLTPVPELMKNKEKIDRAIEAIKELREQTGRVTVEELLAWKNEGRRY